MVDFTQTKVYLGPGFSSHRDEVVEPLKYELPGGLPGALLQCHVVTSQGGWVKGIEGDIHS